MGQPCLPNQRQMASKTRSGKRCTCASTTGGSEAGRRGPSASSTARSGVCHPVQPARRRQPVHTGHRARRRQRPLPATSPASTARNLPCGALTGRPAALREAGAADDPGAPGTSPGCPRPRAASAGCRGSPPPSGTPVTRRATTGPRRAASDPRQLGGQHGRGRSAEPLQQAHAETLGEARPARHRTAANQLIYKAENLLPCVKEGVQA